MIPCFLKQPPRSSLLPALALPTFPSHLLQRQRKGLGFHLGRDNDNSIDIAEQDVSGSDEHTANLNGNSEVMNLIPRCGILPIRSESQMWRSP